MVILLLMMMIVTVMMVMVTVMMNDMVQVKDYLGRKEMHVLAKKTGLTVNQVRNPEICCLIVFLSLSLFS